MKMTRKSKNKYVILAETEADSKFLAKVCYALNIWKKDTFVPRELAHYTADEICELDLLLHESGEMDELP